MTEDRLPEDRPLWEVLPFSAYVRITLRDVVDALSGNPLPSAMGVDNFTRNIERRLVHGASPVESESGSWATGRDWEDSVTRARLTPGARDRGAPLLPGGLAEAWTLLALVSEALCGERPIRFPPTTSGLQVVEFAMDHEGLIARAALDRLATRFSTIAPPDAPAAIATNLLAELDGVAPSVLMIPAVSRAVAERAMARVSSEPRPRASLDALLGPMVARALKAAGTSASPEAIFTALTVLRLALAEARTLHPLARDLAVRADISAIARLETLRLGIPLLNMHLPERLRPRPVHELLAVVVPDAEAAAITLRDLVSTLDLVAHGAEVPDLGIVVDNLRKMLGPLDGRHPPLALAPFVSELQLDGDSVDWVRRVEIAGALLVSIASRQQTTPDAGGEVPGLADARQLFAELASVQLTAALQAAPMLAAALPRATPPLALDGVLSKYATKSVASLAGRMVNAPRGDDRNVLPDATILLVPGLIRNIAVRAVKYAAARTDPPAALEEALGEVVTHLSNAGLQAESRFVSPAVIMRALRACLLQAVDEIIKPPSRLPANQQQALLLAASRFGLNQQVRLDRPEAVVVAGRGVVVKPERTIQ